MKVRGTRNDDFDSGRSLAHLLDDAGVSESREALTSALARAGWSRRTPASTAKEIIEDDAGIPNRLIVVVRPAPHEAGHVGVPVVRLGAAAKLIKPGGRASSAASPHA